MKNIIYPYPFKLSTTGDLSGGIVFQIPSFCKSNHKTKKCRDFYTKECEIEGYKQCPYGFAVSINRFLGQKVIFSCLYIDKISDRKMVQRRLSEKDFMPRISLANYEKSINNISILTNSSVDFYKKENEEIISKETYIDKIEILDNTFHELRKLNQELKLQTEHLIYQSNNFSWNNVDDIKYLSQNIFSTSQLISIRLNTYDFGVNPNLSLYEEKSPIQIHKKFVKVAHCLREYANKFNQNFSDLEEVLEELKGAAEGFKTIIEFLTHVENVKEEIEKNKIIKDGVILSTIHGVKGMEFKNVFIINCVEETIPHKSSIEDNLEEERRLFYGAKRWLEIA